MKEDTQKASSIRSVFLVTPKSLKTNDFLKVKDLVSTFEEYYEVYWPFSDEVKADHADCCMASKYVDYQIMMKKADKVIVYYREDATNEIYLLLGMAYSLDKRIKLVANTEFSPESNISHFLMDWYIDSII